MSKEEAIKYVISNKSWWWRKKLLRNINNGLGTSMIDDAVRKARHLYTWSNYYSKDWRQSYDR